jgi:uncharacterized Zn finger protein
LKCPDKNLIDGLHDMFEDSDRAKCPTCGAEDMELRRQEAFEHYITRMLMCRNCGRYAFEDKDLQEAPG